MGSVEGNIEPSCCKIEGMKKRFGVFLVKMKRLPRLTWKNIWRVGQEDPRRVIHAFKVGLCLTIVSLLYLLEPLFEGVGQNAIWAVMTVVVVLEFTAGATLCKGLNRGLGTLLAGSLAFLIEFIATESGTVFRAIFIGGAVFVIGTAATYMRFFPYIKKNYDYGVVIFLLTFMLIAVSSFRIDDILKIANQRFYMIVIGCGLCLLMSLLVFPIWSGEDLHNSTVSKLEGLAKSIEACANDYFSNDEPQKPGDEDEDSLEVEVEDPIYIGYKAVLDSKSSDEALAMYAGWEPRHTIHCHKFPGHQYVKLGAVLRHFGYTVVALHGCLQTEIQAPSCVRVIFKDPCIRLAGEVSKALMELADSIRNRRHCSPEILSDHLHQALHDLDDAFKSQPKLFLGPSTKHTHMLALQAAVAADQQNNNTPRKNLRATSLSSCKTDTSALLEWKMKRANNTNNNNQSEKILRPTLSKIAITCLEFSEALPFAAFASLLVEAVARLDLVIEEVEELSTVANFKEFNPGDEVINIEKNSFTDHVSNHFPTHAGD